MRSVALFAVVALAAFGLVAAQTNTAPAGGNVDSPNTPTVDGLDVNTLDPMCLLDSLSFTNGLQLVGAFSSNDFHYTCSCSNFAGTFTTQVVPHTEDPGSSAEITFNGAKVNFRTLGNAVSNGGDDGAAPSSPLTKSSVLTFKTGTNVIQVGVGCNGRSSPTCYYQYTITCDKPADGGFVVGDPQFVGLRGQSYQVHGVSGEIYNIVSDADLQYNSKFVFLNEGACPVVNGKKQKGCFSHPGSYLGELGLKTRAGDKIHLVSGSAQVGFASVTVNDKEVEMGETVLLADNMGSVSRNTTHLASVSVGNWDFAFENSDLFVNQRVRVLDARKLRSHGLLGQTWREATYPNAVKYIQGSVDDYVIRDGEIFGDNFVYNTFN